MIGVAQADGGFRRQQRLAIPDRKHAVQCGEEARRVDGLKRILLNALDRAEDMRPVPAERPSA
jgi:hypothetical protein